MKLLFRLELLIIVLISWHSWTLGQEKQEQQSIDCDEAKAKIACVNFEDYGFTDQSPSIFVLEARGRLGNHLMAFVSIMALQKVLKIQPFVTEDTAKYLEQYFVVDDIPVIHREFCNLEQMHFDLFYDSIDDLVEAKHLHKGHVINLWPQGYMVRTIYVLMFGKTSSMSVIAGRCQRMLSGRRSHEVCQRALVCRDERDTENEA